MRALLFTNLYPSPTDSVRGTFNRQLARELARLCDLTVAVPAPWFPHGGIAHRLLPAYAAEFGYRERTRVWDGVSAHYLRYPLIPKISESIHPDLMWFGVRAAVRRMHAQKPFDVVNAHWLYPDGIVAVRLARELGIPAVLTGLGCDVNDYLHDARRGPQIRAALDEAQAITVVSEELAKVLQRAGVPPARITTIPNGVDTSLFSARDRAACRAELGLGEGPLVVCVSRLSPEKGVRFLVEALPRVRAEVPGCRVAIVGDGADRAELEELAGSLGVAEAVRFVGAVPHERVALWLGAATVACMPSLREGHPNAAMEALSSGRPLVASAVGALQGMVDDEVGALVPPGDAAALAAALAGALKREWDPGKIARRVSDASWSRAARTYLEVLRGVSLDASHALQRGAA